MVFLNTLEGVKKGWHNVIGWGMIGAVVLVGQAFSGGVTAVNRGQQAFDKVVQIEVQVDSMKKNCGKEKIESDLYRQSTTMKVDGLLEGQKTLIKKQDEMYLIVLDIYKNQKR
jgi:hypothetical protein